MGKLKGILAAAGAGAKKTLKSADVDALGQFKGKIQKVIDDIDNPTDETRGFGGDTRATQDKMAGPGSHLSHSTLKEEKAKKAAELAAKKKKALERKKRMANKKDNPNALETPGYDKGINTETPQFLKDDIAQAIGETDASFKREVTKRKKVTPKTKNTSKLKQQRAAKAAAKSGKKKKVSNHPKHKPRKRGQDQYEQ